MNLLDHLTKLHAGATPGPLVLDRYEHGGGRLYKEEPRTLVADFYHEGDREFFAAMQKHGAPLMAVAKAAQDYHKATLAIETWVEDGFPDAAHLFAEQARSKDAMFAAIAALGEVKP